VDLERGIFLGYLLPSQAQDTNEHVTYLRHHHVHNNIQTTFIDGFSVDVF